MIESVHFSSFKVLRDTVLPLGRFTLIVGPNGSGKSTALHAFAAVLKPGQFDANQIVTVGDQPTPKVPLGVFVKWGAPFENAVTRTQWLPAREGPLWETIQRERLPDRVVNQLFSKLNGVRSFALDAGAIAKPVKLTHNTELGADGSGLAGVLTQLRDREEDRFGALRDELVRWLPEYDRIIVDTDNAGLRMLYMRTREGHSIPAYNLSQGTLLALCMLTIAYLPDPPPLVCFEEPDRGLHPRLLRDVKDALDRLSYPERFGEQREPVQVIATTHSPYLLDLYKDRSEEIVIAEKTATEARFVPLAKMDSIDEILQGAPLGEVWFSGALGGVPS